MKHYIRIQEDKFGFVTDDIHDIHPETDKEISQEEYDEFFRLQQEGKQFKLRKSIKDIADGLFNYLEETEPERIPVIIDPLEERIKNLEVMLQKLIERLT